MEQKIDHLTNALEAVQQVLLKGNDAGQQGKQNLPSTVFDHDKSQVVIAGESETTIYRNAVEPVVPTNSVPVSQISRVSDGIACQLEEVNKRISSSSEGLIDTSDEMLLEQDLMNKLIVDAGAAKQCGSTDDPAQKRQLQMANEPRGL